MSVVRTVHALRHGYPNCLISNRRNVYLFPSYFPSVPRLLLEGGSITPPIRKISLQNCEARKH